MPPTRGVTEVQDMGSGAVHELKKMVEVSSPVSDTLLKLTSLQSLDGKVSLAHYVTNNWEIGWSVIRMHLNSN
jgi:hypothetical protein